MHKVLELAPGDAAATVELSDLQQALASAPKARLEGHLQAGTHVASTRPPKEKLDEPKPRVPRAEEASRPFLVTESDASKVGATASKFFDMAEMAKQRHEAEAAPLRPKLKNEMFPGSGCEWPEGYGPDAPGWDPTYRPMVDLRSDLAKMQTRSEQQQQAVAEEKAAAEKVALAAAGDLPGGGAIAGEESA